MRDLLDRPEKMRLIDRSDMISQIRSLPSNLSQGLSSEITLDRMRREAIICGMGGSGIGGEILADHVNSGPSGRVFVIRGPEFPGWVDGETLVIVISYSGNTREAISLFQRAIDGGLKAVGVTSNGVLLELCHEYECPFIQVPPGFQPRTALGYLLGATARIIQAAGIAPVANELLDMIESLKDYQGTLLPEIPLDDNLAKKISLELKDKIPVIYSTPCLRSAAMRWQTQMNENAKMMAFSGMFPECNHNHIVGWMEGLHDAPFIPVFLRGTKDDRDHLWLMEKTIEYLRDGGINPLVVGVPGDSRLHNVLSAVIMGDLVSYYLAMLNQVDPLPVVCIHELKKRIR